MVNVACFIKVALPAFVLMADSGTAAARVSAVFDANLFVVPVVVAGRKEKCKKVKKY